MKKRVVYEDSSFILINSNTKIMDTQHLSERNIKRLEQLDNDLRDIYEKLSEITVQDSDIYTENYLYLAKQNINKARRTIDIIKLYNDC